MKLAACLLGALAGALQLGPLRLRNAWLRWKLRRLNRHFTRLMVARAFAETRHLPPVLR